MKDYGIMNARDRLAASEREINSAREKREQENRASDRETRERLERASPSRIEWPKNGGHVRVIVLSRG